ncbi:MAG: hypothetical protein JWM24_305 [Solirubrobacterales bacterium]|nr:hypothetical protein [Solirubrobacterales bacterium]
MINRRVLALAAVAVTTIFFTLSVEAQATVTTYLRPNTDIQAGGWTTVGSSKEWSALDEPVIPWEIPPHTDYIDSGTGGGTAEVGLSTTSLAGAKITEARVFFYTPNSNPIVLQAKEQGGGGQVVSGTFSSTGWHDFFIFLNGKQTQLDGVSFAFIHPANSPPSQVDAAFLRLMIEPPESQIYWGAWMDGDVYGGGLKDAPWDEATWKAFQQHTNEKSVSIVHFGQPAPWNQEFDPSPLDKARAKGAIPLMDMDSDGVTLQSLNNGSKYLSVSKWVKDVKNYGKPFFFRWQWEMNIPSSQLGSEAAANPELFKSVWRQFHNVAEGAGATNITWVWCPNVKFGGSPPSTPIKSLYPGNAYVDWTCMDGYNHGTKTPSWSPWTSFYDLFSSTYQELVSSEFEGHEKPIMIGETASTEAGGSKPEWIAEALGSVLPISFPRIEAMLWFNWNITENGTTWDWPIESSSESTAAFANAISSSYYAPGSFGGLAPLTRIQPLP